MKHITKTSSTYRVHDEWLKSGRSQKRSLLNVVRANGYSSPQAEILIAISLPMNFLQLLISSRFSTPFASEPSSLSFESPPFFSSIYLINFQQFVAPSDPKPPAPDACCCGSASLDPCYSEIAFEGRRSTSWDFPTLSLS